MHREARTEEDTLALGRSLAAVRPDPAGPLAVLYLTGPLGAGKTTFARGFLRGCGVTGAVRSPTFTLLETYETGDLTVVHVDLYRLQGAAETEALGLRDWARPRCLWLIEWPERGTGALPDADLHLEFTPGAASHGITLDAGSAAGAAWLERLERRAPPT